MDKHDTSAHPAHPLFAVDASPSTSISGDDGPAPRHDGWTLEKQQRFCEILASCGVVGQAADAVGLSARSAYAFRNRTAGRAFAAVWDEAREIACRALVDEAVTLAFQGRTVQVIENGEIITERRRNSPARLLKTVERLRSEAVLGDRRVVAASRDFEHCLDLLEAGEAYPVPPREQRPGRLGMMSNLIRRTIMGETVLPGPVVWFGDAAVSCAAARPVGSRGDEDGKGSASKPASRLSHRWTPGVQRRFCEALARCGNVDKACKAVGKGRASAYALRNRAEGEAFALAWDAALLVVSEEMMDTALELAREGSTDSIYRKGQFVRMRRTANAEVMLDTVARVQALRSPNRRFVGGGDFGLSLDRLGSGEALEMIDQRQEAMVYTQEMIDAVRKAVFWEG